MDKQANKSSENKEAENKIDEDKSATFSESPSQVEKDNGSAKENTATEILCKQAERFRMRLIRHFRLLENLNEMEIILETPKYFPSDLTNESTNVELMEHNPYALVKFSSVPKRFGTINKQERRWRRLQCRETSYPPLDLWANWVVESNWFQIAMVIVIVVNAVLLVIDGEIGIVTVTNSKNVIAVQILRTIDYCCLWLFMLEILLKWIDDFRLFWQNGWNQVDFCVTILSVLPEVLQRFTDESREASGSTLIATLGFLRVLRITRLLKIVSRFEQARIILLSVTKAFSAMSFIMILLALFMWIFALMGQLIFVKYTNFDGRANGVQLLYQTAFSDILWSFATLFQLMTLDHWLETLNDILSVMTSPFESIITVVYIFSWLWIGSFVFKNIFAGIMVNNFQTIRNDLHWEKKEKEARFEVDKFQKEITEEAIRSSGSESLRRNNGFQSELDDDTFGKNESPVDDGPRGMTSTQTFRVASGMSLMSYISNFAPQKDQQASKEKLRKVKWDNTVQRHMELSHKIPGEVVWSRDLLFKYFRTMEQIQENLTERNQIIKLLNVAILQMHSQ